MYRPRGTLSQLFESCLLLKYVGLVPPSPGVALPARAERFSAAVGVRGPCTPFRECRLYRHRGKLLSRCLSVWGLYPLPRESSVPTPRDAHSVRFLSLLEVRGACTPPAGVVCTDPAGRFFSRCLSVRGLHPLPRVSSVPTLREVFSAAA